jgi:hypothetical protein
MARSGSVSVSSVLISDSLRNTHSMVYRWLHQRGTACAVMCCAVLARVSPCWSAPLSAARCGLCMCSRASRPGRHAPLHRPGHRLGWARLAPPRPAARPLALLHLPKSCLASPRLASPSCTPPRHHAQRNIAAAPCLPCLAAGRPPLALTTAPASRVNKSIHKYGGQPTYMLCCSTGCSAATLLLCCSALLLCCCPATLLPY